MVQSPTEIIVKFEDIKDKVIKLIETEYIHKKVLSDEFKSCATIYDYEKVIKKYGLKL